MAYVEKEKDAAQPIEHLEKVVRKGVGGHEVSPWMIFKIMAEFISGFEFLRRYKKSVSIYGSARNDMPNGVYAEATKLGAKLAKAGFVVMTGGGPGIMEAANKGAREAKTLSIGLNIQLPFEQRINPYVRHGAAFHFFFTRKVMLTSIIICF
jgi:predicted Rossmann-fold nucleotide-binding protein